MEAEPRARKRRDNLSDQIGAPIYTAEPTPPFTSIVTDMIYVGCRCDPQAAAAVLPKELSLSQPVTLNIALYRHTTGFGIQDTTVGFLSLAVNEHPAPDTGESAFWAYALMDGSSTALMSRHYAPFGQGYCTYESTAQEVRGRMFSREAGEVLSVRLRVSSPWQHQAANDGYIGFDGGGRLVTSTVSTMGPVRFCEVMAFEIAHTAPAIVKALAPTEILWGFICKDFLTTLSVPEPFRIDWDSKERLLDLLDGLPRALLLVSASGQVLHANRSAAQLLALVVPGHADPLLPTDTTDRARLLAALERAATGRLGGAAPRFALPRRDGGFPVIAELTHADPALAGPGTALVLLTDPMQLSVMEDPEVLQLLGLTRAEARVAAIVGTGFAPREAALRLGLQENTVRSTLRLIFDKLGIRRQAELVQIVTRLGGR